MLPYLTNAQRDRIDAMTEAERAAEDEIDPIALAIRRLELAEGRTLVRCPDGLMIQLWSESERRVVTA